MILTKFDIARRRDELNAQKRLLPVLTGTETQYLFAINEEGEKDGICGLDCIILDIHQGDNPESDKFFVDLAIRCYLLDADLYIEQLNIPVLTITTVDVNGKRGTALAHFPDIDYITKVMNGKFRPGPVLKLVVDNKEPT